MKTKMILSLISWVGGIWLVVHYSNFGVTGVGVSEIHQSGKNKAQE